MKKYLNVVSVEELNLKCYCIYIRKGRMLLETLKTISYGARNVGMGEINNDLDF